MREKKKQYLITFVSTHDAIAMEKSCRQDGIAGRLIPVPRQISASCGLAWCTEPEEAEKIEEYRRVRGLRSEGRWLIEL